MQASDYIERLDGIEGYASRTAGPDDTRVAWISLVTPWGLMVRGDSSIQTVYDINPKTRVTWYPGSSFIMTGIRAALDIVGLTPEDVQLVEVGSYAANSQVISEGRADITYTSPLSDLNYEVAANPYGVRWLSIPTKEEDPEAYQKYKKRQTGYVLAPAKSGVPSAHGVMMDQAYQLWHVRGDEDPEFVYQLVKWLDENHNLYKDKFAHAHLMTIENLVEYLDSGAMEPLHDGTIRYLQEKGLWTEKHARVQEFNLKLSKEFIDAYRAAMDAADEQGIMVIPGNEAWVKLWEETKQKRGLTQSYGLYERP
jgi:TRAP transporter TAXI family solute receptor